LPNINTALEQRVRALTKNPRSSISLLKSDKITNAVRRFIDERFGPRMIDADVSDEAVANVTDTNLIAWFDAHRAQYPQAYNAVSEHDAASRLALANSLPPKPKPVQHQSEADPMKLTPEQARWLSTQKPDIRLAINAGSMKFPRWLTVNGESNG